MLSTRKQKSHVGIDGGGIALGYRASQGAQGCYPNPDYRGNKEIGMSTVNGLLATLRRQLSRTEGQGLAEYALILALIAIIAIVALIFLGGQVSQILSNVGNSV